MTLLLGTLFLALSVSLGAYVVLKSFSPAGTFYQKKKIKQRIFSTGSDAFVSQPANFLRQDHLSDIDSLQQFLQKYPQCSHLALLLKRAGLKFSLTSFLMSFVSAACILYLVGQFFLPKALALILLVVIPIFPFFYLKHKNKVYLEKFSEHLSDATSIISNSLKVGQSIDTAMENVGRSAPFPLSVEFQSVCGEIKLGLSLDRALKNLYARVHLSELKVFITGISIQQELGGNLSEIMGNLEKVIRERFALQREIKVLSAQGVMSMWVLLCLPLGFSSVWLFADKELFMNFVTSGFGIRLLSFSAFIQMIAFFWMKSSLKIED